MPAGTNVLLIRHAEKPDSGDGLAIAGQERAEAYTIYFQNYSIDSATIELDFLFAAADSDESHRPRLTIEPLSRVLKLDIDHKHKDNDYQKVADDILQNSKYDSSNILICWHHGEILDLAAALGVDASQLPPQSNWPLPPWPPSVFGWLLQICFDATGNLIPSQTACVNEQLMYDDYGKNPPTI